MKFIKHLLACVAAAGLFAQAANAAVTLSLTPVTSSTLSVGDSVQYYLTISGLQSTDNADTALSGFIIDLDYDSTKVTVSLSSYLTCALSGFIIDLDYDSTKVTVSLSSYLTSFGGVTETDAIYTDTVISSNSLSLSAFSSTYDSSAYSSQSSSFTLATITVTGQSAGSASISIDADSSLSDQNGNTIVVGSVTDATVTVVPEPGTTALLGLAGLLAVMKFRRRFAQAA
ncbi:MAG: PEP-CTERM sorting domain-containing protein [Chthoniobacteraceae bacterium]